MPRPKLEESDPELAAQIVGLVHKLGINRAADVTGISKTTVKAMLRRLDLFWVVRNGALNRALVRVLKL
jgi:hypothetical protein